MEQAEPHRFRVTVSAIIEKGPRILLIREHCGSHYSLSEPVGHVKAHESLNAACIREVKEETGLHIKLIALWGVYQTTHKTRDVGDSLRFVFLARIRELPFVESHGESNIQSVWLDTETIRRRLSKITRPASRMALRDYINKARGSSSLDTVMHIEAT